MTKGIGWIPRHTEAMKGAKTGEMLRGAGRCSDPKVPEWGNPADIEVCYSHLNEIGWVELTQRIETS